MLVKIKNEEMPKSCLNCFLSEWTLHGATGKEDVACLILRGVQGFKRKRRKDCPLEEIEE